MSQTNIAIVGGGLAGGLVALALRKARPEINIKLIEAGSKLGGAHTWSFHGPDLSDEGHALVKPLISYLWREQQVRFPAHSRQLSTQYNSITSEKFHTVIMESLKGCVELNRAVTMVLPQRVGFQDGNDLDADAVIDCRGGQRSAHIQLGYQKFIGQVVELTTPHRLDCPIIMDATVPQVDGYRFLYVLPFDESTALIEDTRYSDGPSLAEKDLRQAITDYAQTNGWRIKNILREEKGVLPIALAGDIEGFWNEPGPDLAGLVPRAGMRAGLFHPLTGYSLPDAAALALKIAHAKDLSATSLYELTKTFSLEMWRKRSFYRLLSRMLFRAAAPDQRYRVLERFYKLPQGLIERFYAGGSTVSDKLRVLAGKPPVPISSAIKVLSESSVFETETKRVSP
ncbi:lycopene beta-cyclase CrtY [Hyphococcus flavus]|uniref:Lycopene beta-cyclase CrtY n=1 Tax=Hyphococcus flavus TaxID=1866326 RepID=A0AAE9ZEA9_9PROT|nr:lycopene beta-cyclase CrtY [Hyphococcus flavus]WDI31492.1 lycopene beta-cyclase CrtY [Hyphococcus flavus]